MQLLTVFSLFAFAWAQADQSLTFEVASIKPTPASDQETKWGPEPGGRFSAKGATLKQLITLAYGVQEYQISGGPKWMNRDRWSIEAKAEGFKGRFNRAQLLQVMKALLADRFQLSTQLRMKDMPVYALVQSKSGPKLKAPAEQSGTMGFGAGFVSGTSVSMDLLARTLSMVLERPVVNQTGLNGEYEVHLEWSPESGMGNALPGESGDPTDLDHGSVSIFTAIQSELGLRLKPKRGPGQVVEILGAKRPSEN
ncbi:MAG: TIGR03435 family protein [Bryobacteraceae bacterium]